ncbi:MAG TPA: rhodanese-like domain-containing protein [Gemmatales bacterium]|nr:rhodanese-like domain-containing protein [Gemmatales bacterium]
MSDLNAREYVKSMGNPEKAVYVICQSGARARKAAEALEAAGCKQVIHVEGGTAAWLAAGLPANKGRQIMPLEQQVRIAAGTLVVLGCALAYLVHPYFLGLAAFVGAGLVYNTCGMALVLARMPWNQVPKTSKVNCQTKTGIDEVARTQGVR